MNKYILFVLILFNSVLVFAQDSAQNKADLLFIQGQNNFKAEAYQKSLDCFFEAAKLYKEGKHHYQYAHATVMLTELALTIGSNKNDTLLRHIQSAENTLIKHLPNKKDTCSFYPLILQNTGVIYSYLGNKDNQKKYYSSLLKLGKKLGGPSGNKCLSDAHYDFAVISYRDRKWESCIQHGKKSLELSILIKDTSNIIYAQGILAAAYGDLGQLEKANDLIQFSLNFTKEPFLKTASYSILGENYADLGDYELSAKYFKKGIDIWFKAGYTFNLKLLPAQFGYIRGLTNLKQYKEALLETEKVFSLYKKNKLPQDGYYKRAFIYQATVLLAQEDLEKASIILQKALKLSPKSPDILLLKAELLNKEKRHNEALKTIDNAIKILTKDTFYQTNNLAKLDLIFDFGFHFDFLTTKANTLYLIGKKEKNISILKQALRNYEYIDILMSEAKKSLRQSLSRQRISFHLKSLYTNAISTIYELYQLDPKSTYIDQAFRYSELTKNLLVAENIQKQNIEQFEGHPKQLFQKEQKLVSKIEALSFIINHQRQYFSEKEITASIQELKKAKKELEAIINTFKVEFPNYYALRYDRALSNLKDKTPSLIQKNEILVEYILDTKNSFAILIDSNNKKYIKKIKLPKNVDQLLLNFRNQLIQQDTTWSTTSHQLYKIFVQPLLPIIKQRAIVFVLDDNLSTIPFEILLTAPPVSNSNIDYAKLSYFFLDRDIRYLFSANITLLGKKGKKLWEKNEVLGFAPGFNEGNHSNLFPYKIKNLAQQIKPLRHSREEMELIAQKFAGDYYIGIEASEEIFVQKASQYRILHLITHTGINEKNNDASWMILFPGDTINHDGLVHNFELYQQKIHAELIVLSACNGGFGHRKKGEGIGSISRAFCFAGSTNIIYSLWPASVYTTPDIMSKFYEKIGNNIPTSKALNQVKRDFLDNGETIYKHPFFWASFVYTGQETSLGNIDRPQKRPLGLILLAGIFIIGVIFLVRKVSIRKTSQQF